jgi:hypothetical protein
VVGFAVLVVGATAVYLYPGRHRAAGDPFAPSKVPMISNPGQIRLPLDAFTPSDEDILRRRAAVIMMALPCMHRFGLDWPAPHRTAPRLRASERRYGLVGVAMAEHWGYQPPIDQAADRAARAEEQLEDSQPAAAQAVLTGQNRTYRGAALPEGGCFGAATRSLQQKLPPTDTELPDRLDALASTAAERDPHVVGRFHAWQDCVRQAGLSYSDPWAANDDPAWGANAGPDDTAPGPSTRERQVARTDAICRDRVNLVGVWAAVEASYQQRLIRQYAAQLDAMRRHLDTERGIVVATITGHPGR